MKTATTTAMPELKPKSSSLGNSVTGFTTSQTNDPVAAAAASTPNSNQ